MNSSGIIEGTPNFGKPPPPRKIFETIKSDSSSVRECVPIRNNSSSPAQILKKKLSAPVLPSQKVGLSSRSNSDLGLRNLKHFPLHKSKSLENDKNNEKYSRLCESRSVTPSPPPPPPLSLPLPLPAAPKVPVLKIQKSNGNFGKNPGNLSPIPDRSPVDEPDVVVKSERPKLLNLQGLLLIGKKQPKGF